MLYEHSNHTTNQNNDVGNTRVGLAATTKIKRSDFGLMWNSALETGGVLVGEEVTITIDIQAVKA